MNKLCIYRPCAVGFSKRCTKHKCYNTNYCKYHIDKNKYIFEIINISYDSNKNDIDNLQNIMNVIQNNDTYDIRFCYNNSIINNYMYNKKDLFESIISYIFTKNDIICILNQIFFKFSNIYSKKVLVSKLYYVMYNTYIINKLFLSSIIYFQRKFRKYIIKKMNKYNNLSPSNQEDPFTLESINNIPYKQRFYTIDCNKNNIYVFDAIELEYYINSGNKNNPYTRTNFSDSTINLLKLFIKYNQLKSKTNDDFQWATPRQAYTEVSRYLENAGFYNDIEWFVKFTYFDCINIIKVFLDMSKDNLNDKFFVHNFELNPISYQYDFSKEIIRLFSSADDNYLLCCYFIKSLTLHSDGFYYNTPEWLHNINFPTNFIDYDTIFMIHYVYYDLLNSV